MLYPSWFDPFAKLNAGCAFSYGFGEMAHKLYRRSFMSYCKLQFIFCEPSDMISLRATAALSCICWGDDWALSDFSWLFGLTSFYRDNDRLSFFWWMCLSSWLPPLGLFFTGNCGFSLNLLNCGLPIVVVLSFWLFWLWNIYFAWSAGHSAELQLSLVSTVSLIMFGDSFLISFILKLLFTRMLRLVVTGDN